MHGGTLIVELKANSERLQKGLISAQHGLRRFKRQATETGRTLTHTFTLATGIAGAASLKFATDFTTAMAKIQTQAGGSAQDVQALSKQVLDLSKTSPETPIRLAKSLDHLKRVGMSNVQAMKALRQSVNLAMVSGADLEETTNALAGAWRTGIKGAKNFSHVVANLNAAAGAGNTSVQALVDAMGSGILPVAKQAGLRLEDVTAALALFTDENVPATRAATRLRTTLVRMISPSGKAKEALKDMGLSAFSLAKTIRKPDGLLKVIELLKSRMQNMSKVQAISDIAAIFGKSRGSATILSMINNLDVLKKKYQQIDTLSSKWAQDIATALKLPATKFKILISNIQHLAIVIGNELMPIALKISRLFVNWTQDFESLGKTSQKTILIIFGIAAISGPVILAIGSIAGGIASLGAAFEATGIAASLAEVTIASIAWPIAAVGALTVGIAALIKKTKAANKAYKAFQQTLAHPKKAPLKQVNSAISKIQDKIKGLKLRQHTQVLGDAQLKNLKKYKKQLDELIARKRELVAPAHPKFEASVFGKQSIYTMISSYLKIPAKHISFQLPITFSAKNAIDSANKAKDKVSQKLKGILDKLHSDLGVIKFKYNFSGIFGFTSADKFKATMQAYKSALINLYENGFDKASAAAQKLLNKIGQLARSTPSVSSVTSLRASAANKMSGLSNSQFSKSLANNFNKNAKNFKAGLDKSLSIFQQFKQAFKASGRDLTRFMSEVLTQAFVNLSRGIGQALGKLAKGGFKHPFRAIIKTLVQAAEQLGTVLIAIGSAMMLGAIALPNLAINGTALLAAGAALEAVGGFASAFMQNRNDHGSISSGGGMNPGAGMDFVSWQAVQGNQEATMRKAFAGALKQAQWKVTGDQIQLVTNNSGYANR
jgi:TP901 family phage tail tape measure protein